MKEEETAHLYFQSEMINILLFNLHILEYIYIYLNIQFKCKSLGTLTSLITVFLCLRLRTYLAQVRAM